MNGGPAFIINAACDQRLDAHAHLDAAVGYVGDPLVSIERCLDVEADPIEQGQDAGEPLWVDAGSMQPGAEAHFPHIEYGTGQGRIGGGLAAAEHDRVDQADTSFEQLPNA